MKWCVCVCVWIGYSELSDRRIWPSERSAISHRQKCKKKEKIKEGRLTTSPEEDVSVYADKSSSRRMSLNRSQYGGCSTGLRHPDKYLGRLRTISRLHVYLVVDQKPAARTYSTHSARLHQCGITQRVSRGWLTRVSVPNNTEAPRYHCRSGRDANLEAFSYSPRDGSFAPLAARPSTCAKCPNLRFLSY